MVSPKASEEPHGNHETLETIWKYRTNSGNASSLSSWRQTHPKPGAASELILDRCSTASSSACAAGAMEPITEGAWRRQHHSSHLPTVGGTGCLAPDVGSPGGGVRRVGRRGLGMAGGRRSDGQGSFWGGLIGPNPTDRGKAGSKRSLLVDGEGGPLSITVAGANVHDAKLLEATLDAIVVKRPQPTEEEPQHLCLDKGYDNPSGRRAAARHGYQAHVRRIGEEKLDASGHNFHEDGVVLVKQTIKRGGRYAIDAGSDGNHKERHVDPGDDRRLGEAVRLAGEGKL